MKKSLTETAYMFAAFAHRTQKRKFTGEPYLNHCVEVSQWVRAAGGDANMVAAALLHDTLEDTPVTFEELVAEFGQDVADLVSQVTDVSTPGDGTRSVRKAMDLVHLSKASSRAKIIKLADMLSNTRSVVVHDTEFAKVYIPEKEAVLDILIDTEKMDPTVDLVDVVRRCIHYAKAQLALDLKVQKLCLRKGCNSLRNVSSMS